MQPNMNKYAAPRVRFVIREKYLEEKMGLAADIFNNLIIKEYIRQVKDNCYYDGVLLTLTIQITLKKGKKATTEYVDGNPNLINFTKMVMSTLKNIAYEKENQIVEILASKVYGEENKITIELERM